MQTIKISTDFSEDPGLRYCDISDESGELFYHTILNAKFKSALDNKTTLVVNLDETGGYASSFLDEAFGNLVFDYTIDRVKEIVKIVSEDEPHWKDLIENETYPQWEERRIKDKQPKKTIEHQPWYRMTDGILELKIWNSPAAK